MPTPPNRDAIRLASINRSNAIEQGYQTYQGSPCLRGHIGTRYVTTKACIDCSREDRRKRYGKDQEAEAERKREWKRNNREKVLAEKRRYRERHLEQERERARVYSRTDPHGTLALRRKIQAFDAALAAHDRALAREASKPEREARQAECRRRANERLKHRQAEQRASETPTERAARLARQREEYRRHKARNPETLMLHNRLKRGRAKAIAWGVPYGVTIEEVRQLLIDQGRACAYCGSTTNLVIDHKTPLKRGGPHLIHNLQWLCHAHNDHKRNRSDSEYRKANGIPPCTPWDSL